MTIRVGESATAPSFQKAALPLLGDSQLRKNLRHATEVIQRRRAVVAGELPDWQALRDAAAAVKQKTLRHLDRYLVQFEAACTVAGGQVHWARDAEEANRIVLELVRQQNAGEVLKIKTMTADETGLNQALEQAGIRPYETDLAELIVQLGNDRPSHIVVPALHRNRSQVREIFRERMQLPDLGDSPQDLTDAARQYLREKFLRVKTAIGGANFLIAETGGVCIVESEGNGRMCLTLPETLILMAGVDKVIPRFQDLEVFLQLLSRSATGERMNPYNSIWTGVYAGDGPRNFHVVLVDNGRTGILADEEARQTLECIRCGACLNACPVYRQTGGHAYGSTYGGPIGAILTPQLQNMEHAQSLPYASSLCGACYEVCPVKINIPEVLIHLRGRVVREQQSAMKPEALGMKAIAAVFRSRRRLEAAHRLAQAGQAPLVRKGWIHWLPGELGAWTAARDLRAIPKQSFREWWKETHRDAE
ncbi:MAG TPA: LutB/LldF family L-lactate oxidation iron-sulfur protein [Acidobacteriaceae bacterium]|nr:LutB/LldF family L-lactate oxidation iron-sulfur protein [Acidobacteriaceae bacterium]